MAKSMGWTPSAVLCAAGILLLGVGGAHAQLETAGTLEFEMLSNNYSARSIAMAGAATGMPSGIDGFHSNPASLGYLEDMQALVAYRSIILDVWGGVVGFGMPVRKTGYWAVNIVNLSEGTVDEVLNDNNAPVYTDREWRSDVLAGSLSWSRLLWKSLSLGASLKGAYRYTGTSGEYYSASGFALDLGAQYRHFGDRLVLGVAGRNLGFLTSSYSEEADSYSLPTAFAVGVSYVPRYVLPLRVALDIERIRGRYMDIEPAVEVSVLKELLQFRGGFAFSERDLRHVLDVLGGEDDGDYQKSQWNTLCLGVGLNTPVKTVDLSIDAAVEFHTVHQASLAITAAAGF